MPIISLKVVNFNVAPVVFQPYASHQMKSRQVYLGIDDHLENTCHVEKIDID